MTWRSNQNLQKTQGNYTFKKRSDDLWGKKKKKQSIIWKDTHTNETFSYILTYFLLKHFYNRHQEVISTYLDIFIRYTKQ